jgi:hypothetical protein
VPDDKGGGFELVDLSDVKNVSVVEGSAGMCAYVYLRDSARDDGESDAAFAGRSFDAFMEVLVTTGDDYPHELAAENAALENEAVALIADLQAAGIADDVPLRDMVQSLIAQRDAAKQRVDGLEKALKRFAQAGEGFSSDADGALHYTESDGSLVPLYVDGDSADVLSAKDLRNAAIAFIPF